MQHEYTRQRQGRDFSICNYPRSAEINTEGNCNNIDGTIGDSSLKGDGENKKSLLDQLELCKAEAERNATPVDGYEPPPTERGR